MENINKLKKQSEMFHSSKWYEKKRNGNIQNCDLVGAYVVTRRKLINCVCVNECMAGTCRCLGASIHLPPTHLGCCRRLPAGRRLQWWTSWAPTWSGLDSLSLSFWNANERRLYVGHVDDTVAPFGFCDGKQVSRNPCVSFVGFPFVNRNSFSLSLSLSLSVSVSLALRELKTARDANGCSSDFRLNAFGFGCHTATVTPTATSTLTATPTATLPIVSYVDNDDAWGCPMLPPAETVEIIMIHETSDTQIPLIS